MPDPNRLTISATQVPALFNASPYITKWMLYHHFHGGMNLDRPADARMSWGMKLQPLVLAQAAEDLKLEVFPNAADQYRRRNKLGCTRDATIICPSRGRGALETKCVFDYRTWMTDYGGGSFVPRHHELQLQTQMYVEKAAWGVIAVWVAGDMHYFERAPIPALWDKMEREAKQFFLDVEMDREPDPFGVPIEVQWFNEIFPCDPGKTIDLSEDRALTEVAIQYRDAKEQESAGSRTAEALRAKLLGAAKDAGEVILADGIKVSIRPHGKGKRVTVYEPVRGSDLLMAG